MVESREQQIINKFGEKLAKLRMAKEWSVRDLADFAGLDYSNISKIENGHVNPQLTTIVFLAEALGIPIADLMPEAEKE